MEVAGVKMSQPMRVLTSKKTQEWYTPPELIGVVKAFYGGVIDLDPASCAYANQFHVRAEHWFGPDRADLVESLPLFRSSAPWVCKKSATALDGLTAKWFGKVFLNPPYCGEAPVWVEKARYEWHQGNVEQEVLLLRAALGYEWFKKLWREFPVCLLDDLPRFIRADGVRGGKAKQGHCFAYMGPRRRWETFGHYFNGLGRMVFP